MGGRADEGVHHSGGGDFEGKVLGERASQVVGCQRTRERFLVEYPRLDIASADIDADEVVEAFLGKRHLEHTRIVSRTVADEEIPTAQIAIISPREIDDSTDVPLVRIPRTVEIQRVMPLRYLTSADWMPKKEEWREAPPLR